MLQCELNFKAMPIHIVVVQIYLDLYCLVYCAISLKFLSSFPCSSKSFLNSRLSSTRGGARNFPTGGLTLPTRELKYGF